MKKTKQVEIIEKQVSWKRIRAGTWFSAFITGIPVVGQIQKEDGIIFLCQSKAKGDEPGKKSLLGHCYSWGVDNYQLLSDYYVENFKILPGKPEGFQFPTILKMPDYNMIFVEKGYVQLEDYKIQNEIIRELASKLID